MVAMMFIGVGLLVAFAIIIVAVGLVGTDKTDTIEPLSGSGISFKYPFAKVVVYPAITFMVVLLVSRWLVAAVTLALTVALIPRLSARKHEQTDYFVLTEALASWIEQLRDAVVSGGGIEMPLRNSATTGPEILRPFLKVLAADLSTHSTEEALRAFAGAVEHHIADQLAAAYVIASANATEDLPDLLTVLASDAQKEVRVFREVELARKKVQSSSRSIIGIIAGMAGVMVLFFRPFLNGYDSMQGQLVLLLICAMTLGSYVWIGSLSIVRRPPRFFATSGDTEQQEVPA